MYLGKCLLKQPAHGNRWKHLSLKAATNQLLWFNNIAGNAVRLNYQLRRRIRFYRKTPPGGYIAM